MNIGRLVHMYPRWAGACLCIRLCPSATLHPPPPPPPPPPRSQFFYMLSLSLSLYIWHANECICRLHTRGCMQTGTYKVAQAARPPPFKVYSRKGQKKNSHSIYVWAADTISALWTGVVLSPLKRCCHNAFVFFPPLPPPAPFLLLVRESRDATWRRECTAGTQLGCVVVGYGGGGGGQGKPCWCAKNVLIPGQVSALVRCCLVALLWCCLN